MDRVSSNLISNNLIYDIHRQQEGMAKVQKQLSSQSKIQLPEDDPVATSELMHQKSQLRDAERFERNILFSEGQVKMTEGALTAFNEALQRARELSVQGANSIYDLEQRKDMAAEVDQLLEHLVSVSNTQYQGKALFGGTILDKQASSVERSKMVDPKTGLPQMGGDAIQKVNYQGNAQSTYAEIGRGEYIKTNLTGSETFFAENQTIVSGTSGINYIASKDQTIKIDGVAIPIKEGDNLQSVVDKINNAGINVLAEVDNSTNQALLTLNTTTPHKIALEDIGGGTVLQDLGVLAGPNATFPDNYAPTASVYENSIFDTLIHLRNGLLGHDTDKVNRSIGEISASLDNVSHKLAVVGSVEKRMEQTKDKISQQKLYSNEIISALNDTDMAESIVKLKQWEQDLQTSLQVGGNLLPKNLLDYLR